MQVIKMSRIRRLLVAFVAGLQICVLSGAGHALSLQDKTGLQAAMQRHVDRQSVKGVYLHLDSATGEVRRLHPVTAHPMIMQMGENFVMCFDFRDSAEKKAEVDFYLARKGDTFVVFHAGVAERDLLKRLMQAGKVTRAD